jgi:hypothetical protein
MRRAILPFVLALLSLLTMGAPSAGAVFGLKDLDVTFTKEDGTVLTRAGEHPYAMKVELAVNTVEEPLLGIEVPDGSVQDLLVTQIPGLAGDPTAVPRCPSLEFLLDPVEPTCSRSTRLGTARIDYNGKSEKVAVYNLHPPPGSVLKLGFSLVGVRVTVELGVKSTPPYNVVARSINIANLVFFYGAEFTLWGIPAAKAHDAERGGEANVPEIPFLTLPRSCAGPQATRFDALSWQGDIFAEEILTHNDLGEPTGFTDCGRLDFSPRAGARPTTDQAESPSGLNFDLEIEDEGLANPTGTADSDVKKASLILPEGMTLNPSVAEGLAVCSPDQFAAESLENSGVGCPQASKVGTVEATTPLLKDRLLQGSLFVAQQDDPATSQPGAENPFDSLIAVYMIIREPELGLIFKLAGKVEPDPTSGQLVTTFDDLPPYPLEHVSVRLREGGRSPLITPPLCGTYETKAVLTPSATPGQPITVPSTFTIERGVGGAPCPPGGTPPFDPGFSAGTLNNNAKSYSPFLMRLTRRDGDQDLVRFDATLPPGVLAKLTGVQKCPDAAIAQIESRTGRQELANPSCPANSRIGSVVAGAGVGSQLTYVPGSVYLAGPFGGNPLSVVGVVPAVAGPFDVGVVATRQALTLDPVTAQPKVDGAASEPIPHILAGIPLRVRDIRVNVDRPEFTLNPTNCREMVVGASLWGGGANPFSLLDDAPFSRSDRFQAANCDSLGFKPKLSLSLKGGTRRGDHPVFKAVVTPRPKDANFAEAVVTLPRSAFLDQAHIRTICTRVQYAAGACPKGAIYGFAKAWSPLLDGPAEGPVYLRSSNHNLPDLVMALKGPPSAEVDVDLVGRIDSHKGGIRGSFETIPDVPVSKFVLSMRGGRKGLIVNSRNLCGRKSLARASLLGQNGRQHNFSPVVRAAGCR